MLNDLFNDNLREIIFEELKNENERLFKENIELKKELERLQNYIDLYE